MTLAQTINEADRLIKEAAECHSQGETEECISLLLSLRERMDEPIVADTPGEDDTSENCKLCGKPQIT